MKNNRLIPLFLLMILPIGLTNNSSPISVFAATSEYTITPLSISKGTAMNINQNDDTENEIRAYYSGLSSLSATERKGDNLLKNLKPILQKGSYYISDYKNTRQAMMITDRDWIQSPLNSDTYAYNTEPKMHVIYRSDNGQDTAPTFNGAHASYDGNNSENDKGLVLNKEHTWPKAIGFNDSDASYEKRAPGTDLHALMMADNNVNNQHSCFPYGDKTTVSKLGSYTTSKSTSSLRHSEGTTYSVDNMTFFEPTDEFKGDIARAQFYMAARYNNLEGDSLYSLSGSTALLEANLKLGNITKTNYLGTKTTDSSSTKSIIYGDLDTLIRWHKLDPVSDYEIHRNNLIDNNYQKNRNPFIDFPEWVDVIWGNSSSSANPSTDEVSTYGNTGLVISGNNQLIVGNQITLNASIKEGYVDTNEDILWSTSDANIASISSNGVVTAKKEGTVTISAITLDSEYSAKFNLTISESVIPTSISLSNTSLNLIQNDTYQLTANVLPNDAVDKTVSWNSSDSNVVSVSNTGFLTAKNVGNATITAKTINGLTATCLVNVSTEIIENNGEVIDEYALDTISIVRNSFENAQKYGIAESFTASSIQYNDTLSGSGDITSTSRCIQANSSSSSSLGVDIYNSTPTNGSIEKIVVNYSSSDDVGTRGLKIYASNNPIVSTGTGTKYVLDEEAYITKITFASSKQETINIEDSLTKDYKYFAFVSTTAIYLDSIEITYRNNVRAWQKEISLWSQNYINSMNDVCDKIYGSTNINDLTNSWNQLKAAYNNLTSGAKSLLKNTDSITIEEYKNNVLNMLSSYRYIVNKYTSLEDFITGYKINNSNHNLAKYKNNSDTAINLIISFAILFASILIIYFSIMRKKHRK